jgi:virulence-associated protein VagC
VEYSITPAVKLFINGQSQAVRLSVSYRFDFDEVYEKQRLRKK